MVVLISSSAAAALSCRHYVLIQGACGAITAAPSWWSPRPLRGPTTMRAVSTAMRPVCRHHAFACRRGPAAHRTAARGIPMGEDKRKSRPTRRESRMDYGIAVCDCPHGGIRRRCTNEAVSKLRWPYPAGGARIRSTVFWPRRCKMRWSYRST